MKAFFNSIMQSLSGSGSKPKIPRSYKAIIDHERMDMSLDTQYLGDTICSLVNLMKKNHINPKDVKIFEVYDNNRESKIPASLYTTDDGKWFPRTELCKMTTRYGKEEQFPSCSFQDRNGKPCGPYYDLDK